MVENELEGRIINNLLNLLDQGLRARVIYFETKFEVLIVKDTDMGLRVIFKDLYNSRRVHQVFLEESWKLKGSLESLLIGLEIVESSHICSIIAR